MDWTINVKNKTVNLVKKIKTGEYLHDLGVGKVLRPPDSDVNPHKVNVETSCLGW
jgi:hypothetical protein